MMRVHMRQQNPPDVLALIDRGSEELVRSGVAAQALKMGDLAPDFRLPNTMGYSVALRLLRTRGPVILSFFQGWWCPFCCLELIAWQQALPTIQSLGASVVAISPQTLEYSRSTVEQHKLSYYVLSDRGNQVARQFGLVYRVPDYLYPVYEAMNHSLPLYNGDTSYKLPIAGTFLVDRNGSILYTFVDPDFTKRVEPAKVIQILQSRTA